MRKTTAQARLTTTSLLTLTLLTLTSCSGPDSGLGPESPASPIIPAALQEEGGSGGGSGRPPSPVIAGEMVVKLDLAQDLPTFNAKWGTTTIAELDGDHVHVRVPAGGDAWDLSFEFVEAGDCLVAEPNYEMECPEANQGVVAFVETGHIFSDVVDQGALARIGASGAHVVANGAGVTVAIVDTGVDGAHPDLAGYVLPGWDFVDDDSDPSDIADGIDNNANGLTDEGFGHGTHVAGIVHAVAPAAWILPVRVLDDEGAGTSVNVARGIRWAVDNGADVINLSLGMAANADVVKEAVKYAEDADVFVAASAGNEGQHVSYHYPAKLSNVVGVAATDSVDLKASFSNFGSLVSISAPGEGILSTYPDGRYAVWSGTSFSTPMVSGGAALRWQKDRWARVQDVVDAVEESATPIDYAGLPYQDEMGEGRINLLQLVLESNDD